MAVGPARPASRRREPRRRQHQYRHRSRGARRAGRLHAAAGVAGERDQCRPLRKTQLRFSPRHRSGGGPDPISRRRRRQSGAAGTDHPRIDRLCQGQSGRAQLRFVRRRLDAPRRRRIVQDDGRRQHRARALSRRRAGDDRPDRRPRASDVRQRADLGRIHPIGQNQAAGGDFGGAYRAIPGFAHGGRLCARLRGQRLVRHRRAEGHARRDRRAAQSRSQRDPRRPRDQSAARRTRRLAACPARPPTSASSLPTRPKSGAR